VQRSAAAAPAPEMVAMAVEPAKPPIDLVRTSGVKPSNAPRIASSDQIPMPRSEPTAHASTDHGAAVAMARAILLPDSGRALAEPPRPQARQTAAEVRSAPIPESIRAANADGDRRSRNEPVRVKTASIAVTPPVARLASDASDTATGSVARRKAEEPAPAPKSEARSGWLVQIGAYDKESAARAALAKARDRIGRSLGRLDDVVESASGNSGRLWRARFAGLKDQKSADAACKVLRRKDFACLALRQ
jgi:D-alanyl-D-alanine carboxypeptidase